MNDDDDDIDDDINDDARKERFIHLVEVLMNAMETGEVYNIFETDSFGNRVISKKFISEYKELIDETIADELNYIRDVANQERQAIEVTMLLCRAEAQVALEQRMEQHQHELEERIHEIFRRHAHDNGFEYGLDVNEHDREDADNKIGKNAGYVYEDELTLENLTPRHLADFDRRLQDARIRLQKNKEKGWGSSWWFFRCYAPF